MVVLSCGFLPIVPGFLCEVRFVLRLIHHETGNFDWSGHLYNKGKYLFIKNRLGNMQDEKAGCIWMEMQAGGIFSFV
jgi:hypothetical protein